MSGAPILDTTIDSVALARACEHPGREAFRCGGVVETFGGLAGRAQGFAGWLVERGVAPGDRIALWLPNGLGWVAAHLGTTMAGAVSVPVSTRLVPREAGFVLRHSGSRVVVAAERFLGRGYAEEARALVHDWGPVTPVVLGVDPLDGAFPEPRGRPSLPGSTPGDPAVIIYTSGTTGVPKGCVLSHRGWTNNARLSAEVAGLTEDDVIMAPSPLFHLFGSLTGFMGALAVGARFVTLTTFDANRCASEMAATGATHLTAVPTMWLDLMGVCEPGRLPALRGGVWGGAGFPRAALERAIDPAAYGWSLQGIYGMTEAPTLTQVRPDDVPARKLDTVGRATPGVEVCIFDPARDEPVDAGQVGEVRARGYNQMLGYLGDEEASRARVMDGWVRTGDLGMLDSEGYLTVVGRITDVIITGGANVYAREVEDVVLEVQGVALAAVVAGPDERLGEVPVAWVQPEAGASLDPEAVRSHCAKNLASYKVPRRILAMESLPLTAGGKVHRARLRELSAQGSALGARR